MIAPHFKKALITGATSGIGEALVELLVNEKIDLILTGRNQEKLNQLKKKFSEYVDVETITIDLSKPKSRGELIQLIHEKVPDLVINNAGLGVYGEILNVTTEDLLNLVEVDVKAVLELTVESAKALAKKKIAGTIMNISSSAGFQVFPKFAVYAASKAFLNSLSVSLDFELASKNIRVLVACPGKVLTDFAHRAAGRPIHYKVDFTVMSADFAAKQIWEQIQKGKRLNIFDWKYKFATFISHFVPKSLLAKLLSNFIPPEK